MGLFSLTQELAIDLGTANTLIIHNGRVVVDEPSIVAIDSHSGKLVAIGERARAMHEKTSPNIKTNRPLKDGVIADFTATELMLRGMIKKVKSSGHLFSPSIKMVICIPSGSTNVEIRAVRDSAEHAGGREVYMIYEPIVRSPNFSSRSTSKLLCTISPRQYNVFVFFSSRSALSIAVTTPKQKPEPLSISTSIMASLM